MREAKAAMIVLVMLVVVMDTTRSQQAFMMPSPWGYLCSNNTCIKKQANGTLPLATLNECKLICDSMGVLWPQPSSANLSKEVAYFLPSNVMMEPSCSAEVCSLLKEAFAIFRDNLNRFHPNYENGTAPWIQPRDPKAPTHSLVVKVVVTEPEASLTLDTREDYHLVVTTEGGITTATINANTFFGARHALETLTQLMEYQETHCVLVVVASATVRDSPAFAYRGLLLDTSRNFLSVATLKRTLDAMAASKLNTLHWHLTDTHSFPLYLESLPNMVYYGAYSSKQVYFPADIQEVIHYAKVRGIRVLPEFDAPAHVGNGWQWGEMQGLGKLAVCVNREPWQKYCAEPPCGQLNLANPNMYSVLEQIYKELIELFSPIDLFHYGGDEVNLECWNTTDEITSWMTKNGFGLDADAYYQQWSVFQEKSRKMVTAANKGKEMPGILWTSHLTEAGRADRFLNTSQYIIQVWTKGHDPLIGELLNKGYRLIISNYDSWYFSCGFGAWVGEGNNWCSPYSGWQEVYDNSPHKIALNLTQSKHTDLILGGEGALWTEQVDDQNLDAKLWPRGAALAERLWTNPSSGWEAAELRLIHHRQRLVQRGVQAERIQPQWCRQNERLCYA